MNYNINLSRKRAELVASYFSKKGISKKQIKVIPWGESKPKESNSTEKGRSENRRVELKLEKYE